MEKSTSKNIQIISAIIAGTLVGAALGVLFAPDKGKKTRNKIANGAKDLTKEIKKKLKKEVETLHTNAEELEKTAESKLEIISEKLKAEAKA